MNFLNIQIKNKQNKKKKQSLPTSQLEERRNQAEDCIINNAEQEQFHWWCK